MVHKLELGKLCLPSIDLPAMPPDPLKDNQSVSSAQLLDVTNRVLTWSERQAWRGWNKHDGLNSPILNLLLGHWGESTGRWPRMIAIQGVMRFPINLRPLLLSRKSYNPKGLALFVQGCLDLFRATGEQRYRNLATELLDLLQQIASPPIARRQWSGTCWGYHYNWQDPGFNAPPMMPNAVVTCFVAEAFLDAYELLGEEQYIQTVAGAIRFLCHDLPILHETEKHLCLGYMPVEMSLRVMDVSILIASVIARHNALSADPQHEHTAKRLFQYVVDQQTDYGAWWYTDPPNASRIRHDNYHTGFILDAMSRYMSATADWSAQDRYDLGLEFYATRLFNADGSPRWMSDCDWPHDIHGAANGILTFSRHLDRYPGLADHIANWSLDNMFDPSGRFYYQQTPWMTKRFTLLRWCNAWMVRALAALIRARSPN